MTRQLRRRVRCTRCTLAQVNVFVLVGGWPGSGKSTLALALSEQLRLPLLAKDEIKEALADGLGQPATVSQSQRLGQAAVLTMLRVARRCPGAVLDSTWFPYARTRVIELPGPLVEVRCVVPRELARSRYFARAASRHPGHLDQSRSEVELWGTPVAALQVGPLVEVDTSGTLDVVAVAARITSAAGIAAPSTPPCPGVRQG
jgi:predicted kinase